MKKSQTPKEQSQTSSRDSAYNGGVSSIADSRSPTPDQKEKKSLYLIPTEERIFFEKRNQKLDKPKKGAKNATEPESSASSRNETPREPKSKMSICPTTPKSKILDDDGLKYELLNNY